MTRSTLSIALGQYSTAGSKSENQDFHGALQPLGPDLLTKGIAIALADGISTSERGAEAAEIAVKTFLDDYYSTSEGWAIRRCGECVIGATNGWLHGLNMRQRPREEGADRERAGLICTFSAFVLRGRTGHVFHVGDGRIARIGDGAVDVLTNVHRVTLGGGQSYLARALGADRNVQIDYREIGLNDGDLFMLSTDGVHEFLADAEVIETVDQAPDLDIAARSLAEIALANGSPDNLTVQLVRICSLPEVELEDLLGADTLLPPAPHLRPGQRFECYMIDQELHSGSRSHTYLARDMQDDSPVVIKVPATEQRHDPAAMGALMLEEWVMRRLAHPNLLAAAPQRLARKHIYSASRHVAGMTLYRWMQANSRPPIATVRAILRQLSAGLEAMHRRGILHRDLRPQNILIDGAGKAVIIDFGSAQIDGLDEIIPRIDQDAAFVGTIQYSAPELYLGYEASALSDVFSLAVIAYQMLTGQLPYGSRVSAANTRAAQRRLHYRPARAHNADIPDWIDGALAHALAIDPRKRCGSPAEFIQNLANPHPRLLRNMPQPIHRRRATLIWPVIAAALAAALFASIITRPNITPAPIIRPQEHMK